MTRTLTSFLPVAALLLASRVVAQTPVPFDALPWDAHGCALVEPDSLVLGTCAGVCAGQVLSYASFEATVAGQYVLDLRWNADEPNPLMILSVQVNDTLIFHLGEPPAYPAWCNGSPCAGFVPDIVLPVLPGDEVLLRLDGQLWGDCGTAPGTTCTFQHLEFVPEVGFVPWHGELEVGELGFGSAGPDAKSTFASAVASLGDLNGDGVPDLAVGVPAAATPPFPSHGLVTVRSGSNPAVELLSFTGPFGQELGASVAAAGDLDGDGIDDLVAGAPGSSAFAGPLDVVRAWSGATGAQLLELQAPKASRFGQDVDGAGDVNLDGVPDLLVGAPGGLGAGVNIGTARVASGADGSTLLEWHGTLAKSDFGSAVAGAGDLDGDGVPDVLVGAPAPFFSASVDPGHVHLLSGTGGSLGVVAGDADDDRFGIALAALGDVDADGRPDFAASAPEAGDAEGLVRVFSGATHAVLWQIEGPADGHLGETGSLAGVGDTNGDGVPDLLVGASRLGPGGLARVHDGATGALLLQREHDVPGARFGFSVAGGQDISGDGCPDLVIGAPADDQNAEPDEAGKVFQLSGAAADYGPAQLAGAGTPTPGAPITLRVSGGTPGAPAWLIVGAVQLELPFKGGLLVPSADLVLGGLLLDPGGALLLAGTWPAGIPAEFMLWLQVWIATPAAMHGFTATNAVLCVATN